MWRRVFLAGTALACVLAGAAAADTLNLVANLSGRNEVPAVKTHASGLMTGDLDTSTGLFTYQVTYKGTSGAAMGAHFYGPAGRGKLAPPVVDIANPANPISGAVQLTADQVKALRKGLWYFSLATEANPAGEIRGQVQLDNSSQESLQNPMENEHPMGSQMHQLSR